MALSAEPIDLHENRTEPTPAPRPALRPVIAAPVGVAVGIGSGFLTWIIAVVVFYGRDWSTVAAELGPALPALALAALVPIVLAFDGHRRGAWTFSFLWIAGGAAAIGNVIAGEPVNLHNYGDVTVMGAVIDSGVPYPRWLGSSALVTWTYWALWRWPPLVALLPEHLESATAFVKIAGAAVASLGAVIVIWRRRRLGVLLATLVPVQLMFASGYDELYPFIGVVFIALLAVVVWGRWERWSAARAGFVIAATALLYVGFVPLALVAVAMAFLAPVLRSETDATERIPAAFIRGSAALGATTLWALLIVAVCWPEGVTSYLQGIYENLQPGNRNIAFAPYKGRVASETSVAFAPAYAFSRERLHHMNYMAFFGFGWVAPLAGLIALAELIVRRSRSLRPFLVSPPFWAGAAALALYLYYFLFFVPKLGPRRDIDALFMFYMTTAFVAGCLVETAARCSRPGWMNTDSGSWTWREYLTLCAVWGNTAVAAVFLLVVGLPSLGHDFWSPEW